MAIIKSDAILLKKTELRETSFLIDFYTLESGKIRGVLKGVRTPQPQFGCSFELFVRDRVVFYEKKDRDIFIVSQCDLEDFYAGMRKDIDSIACAAYIAELLDVCCPFGQRNENIFDLTDSAFRNLAVKRPKDVARIFEIRLMKEAGFLPSLADCVHCSSKNIPDNAKINIKGGGIVCEDCGNRLPGNIFVKKETLGFMKKVAGDDGIGIWDITVPAGVDAELSGIMKNFMNFHLDRRFKTSEFMIQAGLDI